jgi:hypothetical protein
VYISRVRLKFDSAWRFWQSFRHSISISISIANLDFNSQKQQQQPQQQSQTTITLIANRSGIIRQTIHLTSPTLHLLRNHLPLSLFDAINFFVCVCDFAPPSRKLASNKQSEFQILFANPSDIHSAYHIDDLSRPSLTPTFCAQPGFAYLPCLSTP